LEVYPYLEEDGLRIFSDPTCFTVGEKYPAGGEMPWPGWQEKLRAARIPEAVIAKVEQMFADNPWDWEPPDEDDD